MQTRNTVLIRDLNDMLAGSGEDIAATIDAADDAVAVHLETTLADYARQLFATQEPAHEAAATHAVSVFLHLQRAVLQEDRLRFLFDASTYFLAIGKNTRALVLAKICLEQASALDNQPLIRRAHSGLGALQILSADYAEAASHLEQAFVIAVRLEDRNAAAAALTNVTGLFLQMGLYREAIDAAKSGLTFADDSAKGDLKRMEISGNGLICAHRSRDHEAALHFLQTGTDIVRKRSLPPTVRAIFEFARAVYLIDSNDAETASALIQAARTDLMPTRNPRVEIALDLAHCLCQWASRESEAMRRARTRLREIYHLSKQTNIQHDDVLLAMMRVYGTAVTPEEAKIGMEYARELVDYTTSVKKAKFYHQLTLRGVELHDSAHDAGKGFDPFEKLRSMLTPPAVMRANTVEKNEELTAIHEELAKIRAKALRAEIRSTAYDAAENWAVAAEFFDDNTGEHCFRVGHLAGLLAREIGMDEAFCVRVEHAARLHDIGKVAVNEMILLKPGPLNPVELTAMREHTNVGAELLAGTQDETLKMAAEVARYHHEWWNGAGYPAGLSMMEIPLSARVCALADVYDALTHKRAYKHAWTHEAAVTEIASLKGLQFDPSLVPAFLRVLERARADGAWVKAAGHDDVQSNSVIQARRMLVDAIEAAGT